MFPVIIGTLFQHIVASLFGWAVRRLDARCKPREVEEIERAHRDHTGD